MHSQETFGVKLFINRQIVKFMSFEFMGKHIKFDLGKYIK